MSGRIPILVLGGSDVEPAAVPRGLSADQVLTGFKGALPLPSGRCLAAELIERIRASGQFEEPLLVGPRGVYAPLVDVTILDVNGNLAHTLQRTTDAFRRYDAATPVAITSCDILPTAADFRQLLDEGFRPHQEALFWTQMVEGSASAMGASAWKPAYQLRPRPDAAPLRVYPGHLVIVRPHALRMELTIYLLHLAYRYRNRELRQRRLRMIARGLGRLLWEDMREVLRLQPPTVTTSLLAGSLKGFRNYRRGEATIGEVERTIASAFLHRVARNHGPARPVVFWLTHLVSFAKDIDTVDELAEVTAPGLQATGESPVWKPTGS